MTSNFILWRGIDNPGHDSARLTEGARGAVITGAAVFVEEGQPCRLDYRIVCDAEWRTIGARVTGWHGATLVDLEVSVDDERTWNLNGQLCRPLQGCDDIDLSFSPSTNLLPIRRMELAVGEARAVRAAWLRFPDMVLEPLEQSYERVSESLYRYESGRASFVGLLETNIVGFVTEYPGLWQVEASSTPSLQERALQR